MKRWFATGLLALGLSASTAETPKEPALPVIEGREAMAVVNGEPISVDAFFRELVSLHEDFANPESKRARQKPSELLDRLIDLRLVLQEAKNIGLDELPRIQSVLESFRQDALKEELYRLQAEPIDTVDPEEIASKYATAVEELRLRSVSMSSLEDATRLGARVEGGGDFDLLSRELAAEGKAQLGDETQFTRAARLAPKVREMLSKMKPGEVSAPIQVGNAHAMLQILESRVPDEPEVREKIEREQLQYKRAEALGDYTDALQEKYTTIEQALFDKLDYEAVKPGMAALLEDKRIVARIDGEDPVRVKDLSRAINQEAYHGIDRAIEAKRVNERKMPMLIRLLRPKVVLLEAERLELDQTEEFANKMDEFEARLLFQIFVEKIVEPEIRLSESELQAYLSENRDEFSSPEMMRLESLAFDARADAESAIDKLEQGADFQWMRANAEGQADPDREGGLLEFPDHLVITFLFPEGVREAVTGAKKDSLRLFVADGGPFYVLKVRDHAPPVPEEFDVVRQTIVRRVYTQKREEAVKSWIGKLRDASEIEVFISNEDLERLLGGMAGKAG